MVVGWGIIEYFAWLKAFDLFFSCLPICRSDSKRPKVIYGLIINQSERILPLMQEWDQVSILWVLDLRVGRKGILWKEIWDS